MCIRDRTQAHYGLVLKLRGKHAESIPLLRAGIDSQAEGTMDSHFYFHLGDALSRNNKSEEAMKVSNACILQQNVFLKINTVFDTELKT